MSYGSNLVTLLVHVGVDTPVVPNGWCNMAAVVRGRLLRSYVDTYKVAFQRHAAARSMAVTFQPASVRVGGDTSSVPGGGYNTAVTLWPSSPRAGDTLQRPPAVDYVCEAPRTAAFSACKW